MEREEPVMAKPRPKKIDSKKQREQVQAAMLEILNGLIDSGLAYYATVYTRGGDSGYYNYIALSVGDLKEERYDAIRKVVNAAGGEIIISDHHSDEGNLRIWPRGSK
jgi:hypothetical protein